MKENFAKFSENIIFALVALSALVATLFLLPTTSEFFEFNKFTAVLVLTIVGVLLWTTRMFIEKRFTFTRTPIDIPLLILLLVLFVASLSSVDQFTSLFGAQGKLWPAFFPFATVTALYFLTTSNLKSKKQVEIIIWTLVGGTALASVIAISTYFGMFLPFDFAQIRSFSTLGILSRLAILESFIIPITLSWSLFARNKNVRIVSTILTLIMAFSFILINFMPAYIALLAGLGVITVGAMKTKLDKNSHMAMVTIAAFVVLFLVMRFVPQVSEGTLKAWISGENKQVNVASDVKLGNSYSWDIAASTIGKRPLLGTGPNTFAFAFTQLKPRALNGTDQWSVRFDEPSSFFTEIITTTGIFGTLAYLMFAVVIARFIWTLLFKSSQTAQYLPLAAAAAAFLTATFVAGISLSTVIPFFIILGLISILAKAADENYVFDVTVELATLKGKFAWFPIGAANDLIKTNVDSKGTKSQVLPTIVLILALATTLFALRHQIKAYQGEYYYRQSLLAARSNDGNKTVTFLQKAINTNPGVDTYHRVLSSTTLSAALNLSQTGQQLTEDQQKLVLQLAQVAIDQAKVASGYQILPLRLPGISAANVANWETASAVYQAMIGSVNGADVHAVNTLSQAVGLDPENPILHDRLGLLYQRLDNKDLAQRKFEDAVIVKGDFGPAHYHLAKILIETDGDVARIVGELSAAKKLLPENDPALEDINKNLQDYDSKLKEIQSQQQNQQTQNKTDASPNPSATPSPSPSPSASPKASASPSPSPTI